MIWLAAVKAGYDLYRFIRKKKKIERERDKWIRFENLTNDDKRKMRTKLRLEKYEQEVQTLNENLLRIVGDKPTAERM